MGGFQEMDWLLRTVTEEIVAAGAAAGLRFREVGGVSMDLEYRVASCVEYGCVWMGGGVVQKPEDFVVGVVRGFGLMGGDGSKCNQHHSIDGDSIIQKGTNDLLDQVDQFRREESRGVRVFGVLYGCAIDGLFPGMGGDLSALRGQVLEFVQCLGKEVVHRNVSCPEAIVLGNGEPTVQGVSPVDGNGVQMF